MMNKDIADSFQSGMLLGWVTSLCTLPSEVWHFCKWHLLICIIMHTHWEKSHFGSLKRPKGKYLRTPSELKIWPFSSLYMALFLSCVYVLAKEICFILCKHKVRSNTTCQTRTLSSYADPLWEGFLPNSWVIHLWSNLLLSRQLQFLNTCFCELLLIPTCSNYAKKSRESPIFQKFGSKTFWNDSFLNNVLISVVVFWIFHHPY